MVEPKTPQWLVAVSAGTALCALALVWVVLPWHAAGAATAMAFIGCEVGMVGVRWCDESRP